MSDKPIFPRSILIGAYLIKPHGDKKIVIVGPGKKVCYAPVEAFETVLDGLCKVFDSGWQTAEKKTLKSNSIDI